MLFSVSVWPDPNDLTPLTDVPLTVSAPATNVMSPLTVLISAKGLGGEALAAAKVTGALIVTRPLLWFSIFACVPPLSKSERVVEPLSVHARPPVHRSLFMEAAELLLLVVP